MTTEVQTNLHNHPHRSKGTITMTRVTPAQRLAALHSAKTLLTGGENTALFVKSSPPAPNPFPMIRLAEYITTGVDYRDRDSEWDPEVTHATDGLDTPEEKNPESPATAEEKADGNKESLIVDGGADWAKVEKVEGDL